MRFTREYRTIVPNQLSENMWFQFSKESPTQFSEIALALVFPAADAYRTRASIKFIRRSPDSGFLRRNEVSVPLPCHILERNSQFQWGFVGIHRFSSILMFFDATATCSSQSVGTRVASNGDTTGVRKQNWQYYCSAIGIGEHGRAQTKLAKTMRAKNR